MPESDIVVDPGKLAAVLADGLAAIVPAGIQVHALDGMLLYSCGPRLFPGQSHRYLGGRSGTYVRTNFLAYQEDASDAESAARVGWKALDELQDFVDEATHDPWPGEISPPAAYGEVRGAYLHLWYGEADPAAIPVLACEPIPLTRLRP